MSLRAFHIVFITVSTLLFVFLSVWAFVLAPERTATITTLGVISIISAVVMPTYGVYFYRKARKIII